MSVERITEAWDWINDTEDGVFYMHRTKIGKWCEIKHAQAVVDFWKQRAEAAETNHQQACELVAKMHAAAVGKVTGPNRGVVEDVEDLRAERDQLKQRVTDLSLALSAADDVATTYEPEGMLHDKVTRIGIRLDEMERSRDIARHCSASKGREIESKRAELLELDKLRQQNTAEIALLTKQVEKLNTAMIAVAAECARGDGLPSDNPDDYHADDQIWVRGSVAAARESHSTAIRWAKTLRDAAVAAGGE